MPGCGRAVWGSAAGGFRGGCLRNSGFRCSGQGIGRELFRLACEQARIRGAQKLYLSAHSAEETQAFYRAMGCVEAAWYHPELVALEPCDCQMEFLL